MKVELRHIHKHFGPVRANDDISLTIEEGTIFGLLGENGAGKSTLMKVLSGYIYADAGEILLNKKQVNFSSPADALAQGVGMLHQDPLDFPPMTLLDNMLTGRDSSLLQQRQEARRALDSYSKQFGFSLDPDALVSEITVGERQQLEIVRLLWLGAEALILDEPTTGISAPQKVQLFATLKQLAADGKTIIFVSHKLEDVEALCRDVAVLRQGQVTGKTAVPFHASELVEMMFGQPLEIGEREDVPLGKPLLHLDDVTIADFRLMMENVTLSIAEGEVIGIAGLEGSGQRLLMQACGGLHNIRSGSIKIDGADLTNKTYPNFVEAGVAFMPADRMTEGLVPGLTIEEHVALATQKVEKRAASSRIDWRRMGKTAVEAIKQFNIKGTPTSTVESLSGGNQQRTLLALLPENLRLLIMEHPTRGLDVESALYIWGKLLRRRQSGTAIIYSSADLDEILQYSDRIVVCFDGQVTAVVKTAETSVTELGYLIAGKQTSKMES